MSDTEANFQALDPVDDWGETVSTHNWEHYPAVRLIEINSEGSGTFPVQMTREDIEAMLASFDYQEARP